MVDYAQAEADALFGEDPEEVVMSQGSQGQQSDCEEKGVFSDPYREGYVVGKDKKVKEILDFQVSEQVAYIQCQTYFFRSFHTTLTTVLHSQVAKSKVKRTEKLLG